MTITNHCHPHDSLPPLPYQPYVPYPMSPPYYGPIWVVPYWTPNYQLSGWWTAQTTTTAPTQITYYLRGAVNSTGLNP